MLFSMFFLSCGKVVNITKIDYQVFDLSDEIIFNVDYLLDHAVLFNMDTDNFTIQLMMLDEELLTTITPFSTGFSAFLVRQIYIKPKIANMSYQVQIYSLPREYCFHRFFAHYGNDKQDTMVKWTAFKNFHICYLRQNAEIEIEYAAKLEGRTDDCAGEYAGLESYSQGTFEGTSIPLNEKIEFKGQKGIIVRIHGNKTSNQSKFSLNSDQKKKDHHWPDQFFHPLPYYILKTTNGMDFTEELYLETFSEVPSPFAMTTGAIIGVLLSVFLIIGIIAYCSIFIYKLKKERPEDYNYVF